MSEGAEENKNTTDLSGLISGLISNPEALSKMSDIISKIGSNENGDNSPLETNISNNNQDTTDDKSDNATNIDDASPTFQNFDISNIISKIPNILSKMSSFKGEKSIADKQQITLLLAIRPYLSERRKELIDTFIKMNKLSSIFMSLIKEGEKNVLQ